MSAGKPRKPGVATDEEMREFMTKNAGTTLVVVDARNKDFSNEPGDEKHASNIAGNPPLIHTDEYFAQHSPADRPNAINLPYDRATKSMNLDAMDFFDGTSMLSKGKETPIITHCGGGGRGQKAKVYLESQGFTNVINGGGPSVKEHWELFGSL
jgi:rhodanese-related sulfurtransferase